MNVPPSCNDLDTARQQLTEFGLCVMPGVLESAILKQARAAFYREIDQDRKTDHQVSRFALDRDDSNRRLWNLLARDEIFLALAEHPLALALVRHTIGWPALLSNISGNLTEPGSPEGVLHADQIFVPEPWPDQPQGIIVAWALDDMTVNNGATEVVPGSHRLKRHPPSDESALQLEPVLAPAGSLIAFESRVWHRTGANTSDTACRALVLPFYTRTIYRTQENWFLTLTPEFVDNLSDTASVLLGYRSEGLGLTFGRSPK